MLFALLINANPYRSPSAGNAYRFALAAINQGHSLTMVFFYGEGVYQATGLMQPPGNEANISQLWADLASQQQFSLGVCSTSALRRGILDSDQAERYDKPGVSLVPPFQLVGLGDWVATSQQADRVINFGG
jgi:tRNA 2-thiouridine synthesizing protein D